MTPLTYRWDGESLMPVNQHQARLADKQFVVGETDRLDINEERSAATHRHYFAAVNEAWQNLPEDWCDRFPTSEHLRKWCLIKAGYRDERTFPAKSNTQAVQLAAFIRPIDDFAVVLVN